MVVVLTHTYATTRKRYERLFERPDRPWIAHTKFVLRCCISDNNK